MNEINKNFISYMNINIRSGKHKLFFKTGCFSVERYYDGLFKTEEVFFPDILNKAVQKRRAEYLAGRILAREVLLKFGIHGFDVRSNHHRCPIWPEKVVGSISHSSSIAICVAANVKYYSGVGVDIEPLIDELSLLQIKNIVFNSDEWKILLDSSMSILLAATIVFSAKECLFKALYSDVGKFFDFSAARVVYINREKYELDLELTCDLSSSYSEGKRIKVEYSILNNNVITIIALKNKAVC